ncbi:hypothetical protein BU16DRAFT_532502 [Lophium mytilinum]|uniref:Uncharacterized protein n=1 Tax=Lophium mytilinum TaxID=390894 RepID=A0A6A6RBC2_9PEZI|nr:hypothetical protein BU16DRAFT_532502 [Lophium mytilinum]
MSQISTIPPTKFPLFNLPADIRIHVTAFAVTFAHPLHVHSIANGQLVLTNLLPPPPNSPAGTANLPGTVDDLPLMIVLRDKLRAAIDPPELRDHRAELYHQNIFAFDTLDLNLFTARQISPVHIGFAFQHLRHLVLRDFDEINGLPGLGALAALKGLESVTIAAQGLLEWQNEWQYMVGHTPLENFGVKEQVLRVVDLAAVLLAKSRSAKRETLLRVEYGGVELLRCVEHEESGFCDVKRILEVVEEAEMEAVVQKRVREIQHTLRGRPRVEQMTHEKRMGVVEEGRSWAEEQEDR